MKALQSGKFTVYVYREIGERHHLPHCHVRWEEYETVITLPTLRHLAGSALPRSARRLLLEHLDEIYRIWVELNQE